MSKKSFAIAGALAVALVGWMASGYIVDDRTAEAPAPAEQTEPGPAREPRVMRVQVHEQEAQQVTRMLQVQGEAAPERDVEIKAETSGRVVEVLAERGAVIAKGDPIVRLALDDREARLAKIEALVAQREQEYEAARELREEGYVSETQLRTNFAALQDAKAQLEAVKLDIDRTTVRAPFGGTLNTRPVDEGDYLAPGAPVATVVDTDPLKVVVDVPQQAISQLRLGQTARVKLVGGQEVSGKVTYINAAADPDTRTFAVEIEIANADRALPAGLSAEVELPVGAVVAHRVSPALLSSGEDGALGVKTVTEQSVVVFHPVEVVRSEGDGVWVTGLPAQARIITQGQAYVRTGETVEPVLATPPLNEDQLAAGTAVSTSNE